MKQREKSKKKEKIVEEEAEDVAEEVETASFIEIEKLQDYGINAADVAKLKSAGYCTISSLVMATKKDLCNVKGINEAKI
jgi:meiotic recombination protein DMC1